MILRATYPLSYHEGPVRLAVECRRLPGGSLDADGYAAHVLWVRPQGLLHDGGGTPSPAEYHFDADGIVDLPEGCGTIQIVGGKGDYLARIYEAKPIDPALYVRKTRTLRVRIDRGPFTIPPHVLWIAGAIGSGNPIVCQSDGLASQLTTTPERCCPGQVYTFKYAARVQLGMEKF